MVGSFVLCHDLKEENSNKYFRVYNANDPTMNHEHLIFIKCDKRSLQNVLVKRNHIMKEYPFVTAVSTNSGILELGQKTN
jgi:hypothetical protein